MEYDESGTTMGVYSGGYQKHWPYADFDVCGAGGDLAGVKIVRIICIKICMI